MYLRKRVTAFLIGIVSVFAFAFGETEVKSSQGVVTGKLQNGMSYYLYKNKMPENRASVNVVVKAGSLQEEDNQLGMAHFIEHLCFNGTEKYDKNQVVKYYQSIGLNFGGDLNAHTGFDETVYKIQIPTDDKEKFEKGMEVLKEMTLKPTFKQENIDSEKEIIVEEWRLGQGLSQRIDKIFKETLFSQSRYKERFPIGNMDIIRGAKREVLKKYYDRWYHPENMAVVMVGDFDIKYAESVIKKYFDYEETREFVPREEYSLKELPNNYITFKDKEMTYVLLEMVTREDYSVAEMTGEENALSFYKNLLFTHLLSNRVNDEILSGNNIIYMGMYYSMDLSKDRLNTFNVVLNKEKIKEGIKTSVNIIKDMAVNGISKEEFALEKENLRNIFENAAQNQESVTNEEIIAGLRREFLNDDIFVNNIDLLKYYNLLEKQISAKDIQKMAHDFYNDNQTVILFAPDEKEIFIPNGTELENIISETRKEPAKKSETVNFNLELKKPNIQAGTITEIQDMQRFKKIKLSNGIEFLYKETDFEKDNIYISFFKEEGSINDSDTMYLNSKIAAETVQNSGIGNIDYKDVNTFMKGKEFAVNLYIESFTQGADIVSSKKDLETALDCFTYMIKEPQFSEKYYETLMTSINENIKNRRNSPVAVYSDKINEILYQNNIRKRTMTLEDMSRIDMEKMRAEYKEKFSDFGGFKGIIVGAINEEKAKEILEKYFASLPVKNKDISDSSHRFLDIRYPQGVIEEKVVAGTDKKVRVTLYYPLKISYSKENSYMCRVFENLLEISLIDEVREKLGGVYGISPAISLNRYENGLLRISFATNPTREKEVTEAVKKEVEKLINGEIKKDSLESVIKNYRLVYENNQKQNFYWNVYLTEKLKRGMDYEPYTPEEFEKNMTEEKLQIFFKKVVDKSSNVKVILIPERDE